MENEWLQRHLNLSICGILSPRRPPLSFSFLISAPISNLANSLPPIFAWFYLNKLHLASPSWLFQSRLKPASAIQPALRALSCRVGTHPPEPLSPHLDDPAPRWTISTPPPPPSNLFNSSYSHHASHHTHNPMVGRSPSIRALFLFLVFKMLLLYRNILRSGQILWIRGLTRLQTQVGGAREEIFCALQNVFQFSVKVEQHFTLDNFVCQLCWMTRILQTIFCIKQCLDW